MVDAINTMNREYYGDEDELSPDEVLNIDSIISTWVEEFKKTPIQFRYGFVGNWSEKNSKGYEIGLSYIFGYACKLFVNLVKKRYLPKTKDMKSVMENTNKYIKHNKVESRSAAMKLAHKVVRERNTLMANTISEECDMMINSINLGLYDGLSQRYESLRQSLNGQKWVYCNKKTALLAFQFVKYFVNKTGY
jgi:hypothetical protein